MLLALPLVFGACGSDDDDSSSSIVGKWKATNAKLEIDATTEVVKVAATSYVENAYLKGINNGTSQEVLTLKEDKKFMNLDGDDGIYTFENNILELKFNTSKSNKIYNVTSLKKSTFEVTKDIKKELEAFTGLNKCNVIITYTKQ